MAITETQCLMKIAEELTNIRKTLVVQTEALMHIDINTRKEEIHEASTVKDVEDYLDKIMNHRSKKEETNETMAQGSDTISSEPVASSTMA